MRTLHSVLCTSLLCSFTLLTQAQLGPPGGGGSGPGVDQFTSFTTGPIIASDPDPDTGSRTFLINTPVGAMPVVIKPFSEDISFEAPDAPAPPAFRPPSLFSAPLPTGSGARSLASLPFRTSA